MSNIQLEDFNKRKKNIPDGPGVYFFLGKNKKILYIGKAASLRSRVRSYFARDIAEVRSALIAKIVREAKSIDWRATDSVLEALILEANLIKNYKPKGNTDSKDDKSWNYVVITREDFPRVLLVRGKELASLRKSSSFRRDERDPYSSTKTFAPLYTFGPFPHGLQLKEALKVIRKIFPYRDTCVPNAQKPCFNRQIGLCPGVCSGEISRKDYRKIVRRIVLLFSGKKGELIRTLKRDMRGAAKEENFEEATQLRKQLFALQHIQDISLIKEELRAPHGEAHRIEAYDIAHLGGLASVGVMTVVEEGEAKRNAYRKFRIKQAGPGDDTGALREVLSRRLGHDEWPLPRLVVVDGSLSQINAAKKVLEGHGMSIPVVGVVKDEKHRPREIKGQKGLTPALQRDILLANAEAHRFAIGYHRKRSRTEGGIL